MDMGFGTSSSDGIQESHRQQELLAWATHRIDQLTRQETAGNQVGDMLDWMAHFTREQFGFQQRLLKQCAEHQQYLFDRVAVHNEFRRKLARICVDMMRGDVTVPQRLQSLSHELLEDSQAQAQVLSELMGSAGVKLRRKPRRGELATEMPAAREAPASKRVSA